MHLSYVNQLTHIVMSKKILLLLGVFACLIVYVFGQLHGTSPNWTAPVALPKTSSSINVSKGGVGQNLIRLQSGAIIQCFLENPGVSTAKIRFAKSTDDGNTWSLVPGLDAPFTYTTAVSGPTIAKDTADNIHVIWIRNVPTKDIYYAKFDKNFNLLIDTVKITSFQYHNSLNGPYITVDRSNKVHITWHDGNVDNPSSPTYFAKVMYRQSPDGGVTWNNQLILSDITVQKHAAFARMSFAGAKGDVLAIPWRQEVVDPNNWDVWMAYSTDGGNSWTRKNVANSDSAEWDPGIVVDRNNRIHLHYHEYKKGNLVFSTMEYKYTDDLGASWSPVQTLSIPNIRSQLSVFAYDYATNLQCICWKDERDWINNKNTRADIMCSFSTDSGNTWVGQEFINDLDTLETIFKSTEVGSNGALYATYEYTDPATNLRNIWFTKRASALSIDGSKENNFSWNIFPNPSTNTISIQTELINYAIDLYDITGKLVFHSDKGDTVDIRNIPSGMYLLKISSGSSFKTRKIIIQK